MIFKGRSPTMRHVSRTHRVALDWLCDRIKLQNPNEIHWCQEPTRGHTNQGNFTREEWNHLLCLFNISHFSSTGCSEVMSKGKQKTQKDSGEERVTAKSKPMMNQVSRYSERTLYVLASTASESSGKTRLESQLPLGSWNEQHQRTGRPVLDAYSSSFSEWIFCQEWKSDEVMEVRTERLVHEQPPGLLAEHTDKFVVDDDDMDSDTVAESDMSLLSRSFVHKVNDRVRKIQDQSSKDETQDSNKHSLIWWMFMSSTLEASVFMVKNYLEILHSIKNKGKNLTMKQMFDISEKLMTEQSDEIWICWNPGSTTSWLFHHS